MNVCYHWLLCKNYLHAQLHSVWKVEVELGSLQDLIDNMICIILSSTLLQFLILALNNTTNILQDPSCETQRNFFLIISYWNKILEQCSSLYNIQLEKVHDPFWLQKCWHSRRVFSCMFLGIWWNSSHECCGNLGFPACCMTLDDIFLRPTQLTAVAWPMSDYSDTIVSSLFWLPPAAAACWSRCVFQPCCVSVCAMLNRLQLCVTSLPFATIESIPSQARTQPSQSSLRTTHIVFTFSNCIF